MNKLQCIIADDEPIARQILENYIEALPSIEIVASCKNAFEVLEVLQEREVDILFLDINMPKLSGLSLLKSLRIKPSVIITSAYEKYAIEGYALDVTDYLLKPFSLERLIQAVNKVKNDKKPMLAIVPEVPKEKTQFIFVKSDKKILKLQLETIQYIEAYGNYIKIYTDRMILTPQPLSEFLRKLPNQFIRIHKSFVINFDRLQLIDGNQIRLENETALPIGKSYRKAVLDRL